MAKIKLSMPEVPSTKELEPIVDEDIANFNSWFEKNGNEPIIGPEKAILKTYLYYKFKEQADGQ